MRSDVSAYDWAVEFDGWAKECLVKRDHPALIDYGRAGRSSRLAVPTAEHYLPLLYAIALQTHDESVAFFCERLVFGSISMRGLVIG